jgi:mRNA interferase RelE/StbE
VAVTYRVAVAPAAERQLKSLPFDVRKRITARLLKLEHDPYHGSVKLEGDDDFYRVRIGEYRAIYQVRAKELIVLILRIGHRKEIYRHAPR